MHRFIAPLAVVAAVAANPAAAQVQIAASGPTVEMTITESIEAEPDIASVSAGVTTEAETAVEAMRLNAQAMSAVIEQIRALDIPERDIQTTGINLGARYDYDQATRRQVFRGYQASNRVSVKMRDIPRIGEVLDLLVGAGATDIGGPSFSLEDDSAERAEARRRVMQAAHDQASAYAAITGYSGVRLLQIREGGSSRPPQPMGMRAVAAEAAPQSTPVQPGLVEAGVSVTVTYELTN